MLQQLLIAILFIIIILLVVWVIIIHRRINHCLAKLTTRDEDSLSQAEFTLEDLIEEMESHAEVIKTQLENREEALWSLLSKIESIKSNDGKEKSIEEPVINQFQQEDDEQDLLEPKLDYSIEKIDPILDLAAAGKEPSEIAQDLRIGKGEVELIIKLARLIKNDKETSI